jgi:hypothetical protein
MVWCKRTAAACAALTVTGVQANRPLNTDTADVIERGQCQFEPFAGANHSSATATQRFEVLQLNCGVPRQTQLGVAFARASAAGASSDIATLAGKTNWIELRDAQTGVGLAYGLAWARAPGNARAFDTTVVNLIASREIGPSLLVHANLGTLHSRLAGLQSTTWGLATEWSISAAVTLSGEAFGDDRSRPWVSTGAHWTLGERLSVNASFGVETEKPRVRQFSVGFNFQF